MPTTQASGETGHAMTEWQGPFVGLQELLVGCASVGAIAGLAGAAVAAWTMRRRWAERHGVPQAGSLTAPTASP
jgi:membrane associated rhomboid family serine protease